MSGSKTLVIAGQEKYNEVNYELAQLRPLNFYG